MDTTVLYAQNRRTLNVSEKDARVRSPYNTLPDRRSAPGPIREPR